MPIICQKSLPFTPWMQDKTRKLPGIQPVPKGEWLLRDDAFAAQMDYREELLKMRRAEVFRATDASLPAQVELLDTVLSEIDYSVDGDRITRPDGGIVSLGSDQPIVVAARLIQEDLILMENLTGEPELTAAVLCFPASWTLDEKFTRGLIGIHGTVDEYDADVAKRVQRMFDAIRPEQPLWRANFMIYADSELHQPRLEGDSRADPKGDGKFARVERQTLRKLPKTGVVVFGIHTYVVPLDVLDVEARKALQLHQMR